MKVDYYWAGLVVLVILIVFLWMRYRGGAKSKMTSRPKRKTERLRSGAAPPGNRAEEPAEEEAGEEPAEEDEAGEGDETAERADRLYRKVHRRMAAGIEQEEFQRMAGADGGGFIYPMLAQLYNKVKQEGRDPLQSITVQEYQQVLRDE